VNGANRIHPTLLHRPDTSCPVGLGMKVNPPTGSTRDRNDKDTRHEKEVYVEISYTLEDIKRAQSDEDDKWKFGNDILYQLCHDQPKHNDDSVIIAKIWLIGRSYAAAFERRKDRKSVV
jgi:hypothetical protein